MSKVVKVDGDLITIDPKIMEVGKIYPFYFKDGKYAVYKRDSDEIVVLEETR